MKELLKSGLKTFLPTLGVVAAGFLIGTAIANGFVWLVKTYGGVASSFIFICLLFLFIWGSNTYSDYKLQKALKKIDEEYEETMKRLKQIKTK